MDIKSLNQEIGNIDIYLLDQMLKGRFEGGIRILDAGCGEGRNITYLIKHGYDVWGIDPHEEAIRMLRFTGKSLNKSFDTEKFITGSLEEMPFPPHSFDGIICSAVLHFAKDHEHFRAMFEALIQVLKPGGWLFIRTATNIGIASEIIDEGKGKFQLPDGSTRYLLTRKLLNELMDHYQLKLLEPFKTVIVENARSMATIVLEKEVKSHGE